MKVKELISQLSKFEQDREIYIAQHIEVDGEHVNTEYMEIEIDPWNEPNDGVYFMYPGDLISG